MPFVRKKKKRKKMGFKINYIQEINDLLMKKRTDNDIQTTLSIPEHKFKKISEKFNYALKAVYELHREQEAKMFHILLSLQNNFDMQMLIDDVLDDENREVVIAEMNEAYNIKIPPKEKEEKNSNDKNKEKKRRSKES